MLGLFGIFGRSRELRWLDEALRAAGLHPRLVPEAVKLATLKQLDEAAGETPASGAATAAAQLLGYCILGAQGFAEANDARTIMAVESRLAAAVEAGDNLDARLVLLCLHAGVIEPAVVHRYGLEVG